MSGRSYAYRTQINRGRFVKDQVEPGTKVRRRNQAPKSDGATLHQLRHSALTHDAEAGASSPMLTAKSGHTSVASLARYARPSAEALAR